MARRRTGGAGRPRRSRRTTANRWIALVLGVAGVLLLLVIVLDQAGRDRHFLDSDRTTEATVLKREG
ncbi:hypothetical protein [Micromonospora sp. SL4-19]|uniref:hypothetical protein n=1 Tax=Micromonospora sp. SL4-19 TaxID=3399129 RepID=UPI003A4DAEA3